MVHAKLREGSLTALIIRDSWFLIIRGVQQADAGRYICQLNTEKPISISGTLSVVGT